MKQHKEMKRLKNQSLRDHMSEAELIFTALAELSTRQIAERVNATGLAEGTYRLRLLSTLDAKNRQESGNGREFSATGKIQKETQRQD